MPNPPPPIPPESWFRDTDASKDQSGTNANFWVYWGLAAIGVFVFLVVWSIFT